MEKKPILFRTFLVLVVIAVFVIAMYPLTPRNFYETFRGLLKDPKDPKAAELVADAKARQEKKGLWKNERAVPPWMHRIGKVSYRPGMENTEPPKAKRYRSTNEPAGVVH